MNSKNIYSPSYEHEAKTKFFKYDYWGIAALISTLIGILGSIIFMITTSINNDLNLGSVLFANEYLGAGILLVLTFWGAISLGRVMAFMLFSYKIDSHQIVMAQINRDVDFDALDFPEVDDSVAIKSSFVLRLILMLGRSRGNGGYVEFNDMSRFIRAIQRNTIPQFVERFFDDDAVYKKVQVYHNPVFVRETARHVIYQTDEKKIKIRKLYAGLGDTRYDGKQPIRTRIVNKVFIICAIFVLITAVDIAIGTHLNNERIEISHVQGEQIGQQFMEYGYSGTQNDVSHSFYLEKECPFNRTSQIELFWGRDGSVESVDAELFFAYGDQAAIDELKCFVESIPQSFDSAELAEFYRQFESKIEGDDNFFKLYTKDGNYKLVLIPENKEFFRVYFRED